MLTGGRIRFFHDPWLERAPGWYTVQRTGERMGTMSKYDALWEYVQGSGRDALKLTFREIQDIAGVPIDHSFLKYKKELADYGYQVEKISMKEQTVLFSRAE